MAINHRCTVISELNSSELGNHRVYPPRKDFDPGCASRCWGEMAVMRASAATNGMEACKIANVHPEKWSIV